jgi:hypothetical protein
MFVKSLRAMADDSDLNIGNNIEMRETQFSSMFCQKTLGNYLMENCVSLISMLFPMFRSESSAIARSECFISMLLSI